MATYPGLLATTREGIPNGPDMERTGKNLGGCSQDWGFEDLITPVKLTVVNAAGRQSMHGREDQKGKLLKSPPAAV